MFQCPEASKDMAENINDADLAKQPCHLVVVVVVFAMCIKRNWMHWIGDISVRD